MNAYDQHNTLAQYNTCAWMIINYLRIHNTLAWLHGQPIHLFTWLLDEHNTLVWLLVNTALL